ncbi:hypothetical protein Trydic_g23387 [Trypoxylus dichotomus]
MIMTNNPSYCQGVYELRSINQTLTCITYYEVRIHVSGLFISPSPPPPSSSLQFTRNISSSTSTKDAKPSLLPTTPSRSRRAFIREGVASFVRRALHIHTNTTRAVDVAVLRPDEPLSSQDSNVIYSTFALNGSELFRRETPVRRWLGGSSEAPPCVVRAYVDLPQITAKVN